MNPFSYIEKGPTTIPNPAVTSSAAATTTATDAATTTSAAAVDDIIPWKISNRYYTADVHFKLIELTQWSPLEVENVPAVVYAWSVDQVRLVHLTSSFLC